MNDQEMLLRAVCGAQLIFARFSEPRPHPDKTIKLLADLDHNDVMESVDRLEVELGLWFP